MRGQNSVNQWRNRFRGAIARMIGTVAVSVALVGCGLLSEEGSYRARMTVVAETSTGPRSGSSVIQINAAKNVRLLSEVHQGGAAVRGEAVILEMPDGPVFILLSDRARNTNGLIDLAVQITKAFDPTVNSLDAGSFLATVREIESAATIRTAILPRADWPVMVRFRNINDPSTVEFVEPEEIGVKRIVLASTRDTLTRRIDARLKWLPGTRRGRITEPSSMAPASGLYSKFFNTEPRRDQ